MIDNIVNDGNRKNVYPRSGEIESKFCIFFLRYTLRIFLFFNFAIKSNALNIRHYVQRYYRSLLGLGLRRLIELLGKRI